MSACPCGSGAAFDQCCGPIIRGEHAAPTAEALMRSRYTAYTLVDIDFLTQSLHPDARHDHDPVAARHWAERSRWLGLEVLSVEQGGEADAEGRVEFVARYKDRSGTRRHHEVGRFTRHDGHWYYLEGLAPETVPQARSTAKPGRNDPCPCGSGKKYKKCCGI